LKSKAQSQFRHYENLRHHHRRLLPCCRYFC
jgi:hypothetical protein